MLFSCLFHITKLSIYFGLTCCPNSWVYYTYPDSAPDPTAISITICSQLKIQSADGKNITKSMLLM